MNKQISFSKKENSKSATSIVFISSDHKIIKKKITDIYKACDIYKREKYIYQILDKNKIDWCPKLLEYNDEEQFFLLSYCGERLTIDKYDSNIKKQFQIILKDLSKFDIQHNDIKLNDLLILDDKLYLCDYGWATINNDLAVGINLWNKKQMCDDNPDSGVNCKFNKMRQNYINQNV
jgi:tRNA A-37 threonylcarbamoyl transferase component Bud32